MEDLEMIHCEQFHCDLTAQGCIDRRKAFKEHGGRLLPTYPECQTCVQFDNFKKNNSGGRKAMTKKVDDGKLRLLVSEGKNDKEIAAVFGVGRNTIWMARRRLGLKANYADRKKSIPIKTVKQHMPAAPAKAVSPLPVPGVLSEIKPDLNREQTDVPVKINLVLGINIKVNTEVG